MKRRAFTLVEILFAAVIGAVLLGVLYAILSGSVRQFSTTQRHLGVHSTAQIVLDIVQDGLAGMLVDVDEATTLLRAEDSLAELSFYVSRKDRNSGFYRGHKESFGSEAGPTGNYRVFVHNGRRHNDLMLESLSFRVVTAESITGKKLYYVQTSVSACNDVPTGDGRRTVFTLVGLTALTNQTAALLGRHWNPNPYIYKRF